MYLGRYSEDIVHRSSGEQASGPVAIALTLCE